MTSKRTLAHRAIRAKIALAAKEARLQEINKELVDAVGTGGETFNTTLGTVTVSQQTQTRPSGQTVIRFDQEQFNRLNSEQQALLINMGVVRMEQTQIVGQAPRVQFRLAA